MSNSEAVSSGVDGSVRRQVPTFVIVGLVGYVVDSFITYALARGAHVDPLIARIPAYAIATVINFALNRTITFSESKIAVHRAFLRYLTVCAVGFVVNYIVYFVALKLTPMLGIPVTPAILPVFVAMGAGVAMFFTFFGFRLFAFRA